MQLSSWHYYLARLLVRLYYRVHIATPTPMTNTCPTIYIASHRNGAIDGYVYTVFCGRTPSLISIQLLRKWWQRLLFAGIPVVRDKDVVKYGIKKSEIPSPINAAIQQIANGGNLVILPEGSSEFYEKPLPYQTGAAIIMAKLQTRGVPFQVQPLGVFYTKPDGFRSRVSIVAGEPFVPQTTDIKQLHHTLTHALNAVSVNCPDVETFNRVQAAAFNDALDGEDYGIAFLRHQQSSPSETITVTPLPPYAPLLQSLFTISFLPLTTAARIGERFADGRNTVTFFRLLAALAALPLQAIYTSILLWQFPLSTLILLVLGIISWRYFPEPSPKAL